MVADICLEEKVLISINAQSQRWYFKDGVPWQRVYILLLSKFSICQYSSINFICKSWLGLSHHHPCVCASAPTVCILSTYHFWACSEFCNGKASADSPPHPPHPPQKQQHNLHQHSGTGTITVSSSTPWPQCFVTIYWKREKARYQVWKGGHNQESGEFKMPSCHIAFSSVYIKHVFCEEILPFGWKLCVFRQFNLFSVLHTYQISVSYFSNRTCLIKQLALI